MTLAEILKTFHKELEPLLLELRKLRKSLASIKNAHKAQKDRADKSEKEKDIFKKEIKDLKKENKKIKEKFFHQKEVSTTFKGMIFKTAIRKKNGENNEKEKSLKKRGAQKGHKHHMKIRRNPDQQKQVYKSHCPDCGNELKRSGSIYKKIVEDIIPVKIIATEYTIERQRCKFCQKSIIAVPTNTLPFSPFGMNIIGSVLFAKYRLRLPLNRIQEKFKEEYDYKISIGAIQGILYKAKKWNSKEYLEILERIRNADVKHADETGFRIDGLNGWAWLFATQEDTYYTIEETRGSGVPEKVLGGNPKGILNRDDFRSYNKIHMIQQSCWAHLLRVAKDISNNETATTEVKKLYLELKSMFAELLEITQKPFNKKINKKYFDFYLAKLILILEKKYSSLDTKKIQTRIKNQFRENKTHHNLLTTLLFPNVPLTNNHAERQIRPIAVMRKISGGCRSDKGAATLAVNMSIIQSMSLKKQNIFAGIKEVLNSQANRSLW